MENIMDKFKREISDVEPIESVSASNNARGANGIPLSANFNLNAQVPLDDRQFAFTIADRDAIPEIRRWEGMTVFVAEGEGITYQLKGGITNEHWTKFGASAAEDVDGLHAVATSGDYRDLENTPTKLSEFDNDTKYITLEEVPTDIAYGVDEPSDEHKNLWFDVKQSDEVEIVEEGLFLLSPSNRRFKLCVSNSGRLSTQEVDATSELFAQDIIVLSEDNIRFKICVNDDGSLYAQEAN